MPRRRRPRGAAVIVISSDFQELLGLAHRIVVISDGRSVADMPSSLLNEETLTLLAAPRLNAVQHRTAGGPWSRTTAARASGS